MQLKINNLKHFRTLLGRVIADKISFKEKIVVGLAALLQSIVIGYNFLINDQPIIGRDALLFQYSGWYMSQGGVIYSGIWDIKPPFIYYMSVLIARVTGKNMVALYFVSAVIMSVVFLLIVMLMCKIVNQLTDNERSAFISSLFLFTFPAFYTFSARGLRPKMMVLLFGLITVYFLIQDRLVISAISGAIAAGFWQMSVIFAVVPTMYLIYRRDWRSIRNLTFAILLLVSIAVVPYIYYSSLNQLIAEVVIGPFLASEPLNYPERLIMIGYHLKFSSLIVVLGGIGLVVAPFDDKYEKPSSLLIFGFWFLIQVLLLDMDGSPDLFLGFTIAAIGLGVTVDKWPDNERVVLAGVSAIVILMAGWLTLVLITKYTFLWSGFSTSLVADPSQYYGSTLSQLYWDRLVTNNCHIRLSGPEKEFMKIVGETTDVARCGKYNLYHLLRVAIR